MVLCWVANWYGNKRKKTAHRLWEGPLPACAWGWIVSDEADPMKELEPISDTKVSPATGISAIALHMAMKYHDITMVKDGALYQQYKIEGKNMTELHLDVVFETAIKIEAHLLASSDRISGIVIDAITQGMAEDEPPDDGA